MLAKSLRNKFYLLLVIFFATTSCERRATINTEILCNDTIKILVKFVKARDVADAIKKSVDQKKVQGTAETYTPIRLKDGRSFRVEKISPEDLIKCVLRESKMGVADPSYVRHF
jgi:hypothetical protein